MNKYGNSCYKKGVRFGISQRQCSKRSSRETYHQDREEEARQNELMFLLTEGW